MTELDEEPNQSAEVGGGAVQPLSLFIDDPTEGAIVAQGRVSVSGHLRGAGDPAGVAVRLQASGQGPVTAALMTPDQSNGSARAHWKAHVDGSTLQPGPVLLTAMAGAAESVARRGFFVVSQPEGRAGGTGFLDEPEDGATAEGDMLRVRGWCLFDDSHVARVDVSIDGTHVGRARLYVDVTVPGSEHTDASAAGFEAYVNVRDLRKGRTSTVAVRATSLQGDHWVPPSHTVSWESEDHLPAADLQRLAAKNRTALEKIPNSRTNVVVFTHDLGYGGGQLWLMELLRQARAHAGLACRVVAPADGPLRETLESMGIPVHVTTQTPVKSAYAYEGRVHELASLIRENDGGVVLANTLTVFAAIEAAERANVPSLWAIHESIDFAEYCYLAWGPGGIDLRARKRIEESFTFPKGLVFEAARTAHLFGELRAPAPSFVVDYGVDIDEIDQYRGSVQRVALRASAGFGPEDKVVLVMGTFEPRKAQAAVVAVFDELLEVHENVHLVLVGANDTHYAEAVETQIGRTRWGERIHVIEVTSDIHAWYELADILLCASDMESLPRSIIEAMAFELPVVSTDVYGIADLIDDGKTGWLTRDRDLGALAGLLHIVLEKPGSELRRVATTARAIAHARHGSQSYGKLLAQALQGLLDDSEFDVGSVLAPLEG